MCTNVTYVGEYSILTSKEESFTLNKTFEERLVVKTWNNFHLC